MSGELRIRTGHFGTVGIVRSRLIVETEQDTQTPAGALTPLVEIQSNFRLGIKSMEVDQYGFRLSFLLYIFSCK